MDNIGRTQVFIFYMDREHAEVPTVVGLWVLYSVSPTFCFIYFGKTGKQVAWL